MIERRWVKLRSFSTLPDTVATLTKKFIELPLHRTGPAALAVAWPQSSRSAKLLIRTAVSRACIQA